MLHCKKMYLIISRSTEELFLYNCLTFFYPESQRIWQKSFYECHFFFLNDAFLLFHLKRVGLFDSVEYWHKVIPRVGYE